MMTSTFPQSFVPGYRLQNGTDLNEALANPQWSTTMSMAATTGGTAATSAKIVSAMTNITSATSGAGVTIPRTAIGRFLVLINSSANPVTVFAEGTATINGGASYTLPAGESITLSGIGATAWQVNSYGGGGGGAGGAINVLDFGAVGDAQTLNALGQTPTRTVSITGGQNTLTIGAGSAVFASTDVGKTISINSAGPSSASGYPGETYLVPAVGNGYISSEDTLATRGIVVPLAAAQRGVYKVRCTSISPSIQFTVYDPSGVQVGSPFTVPPYSVSPPNVGGFFSNEVQFYVKAGSTPFALTDVFDVLVLWTPYITTISQYVSPTQVVLSGAGASHTVSSSPEYVIWGTDNTAEIQSAINSSPSAVYVPAGGYIITSRLILTAGQSIFGDGFNSNIKQITPSKSVIKVADGSSVRNLRLSLADGINVAGEEFFAAAVFIRSVNNVIVEDNWIDGGDYGVCGVFALSTKNAQIRGNIIYGNKWTNQLGGNGVSEVNADILVYGATKGVIIEGNHCLSSVSQGISFPNATDVDWVIANNVVVTLDPATCYPGGTWTEAANGGNRRFSIGVSYGKNTQEGPRAVVNGNLVRNAQLVGIYRTSDQDNTGPVIISNNMISNVGWDTTSSIAGGINVSQAGRDIITGNSIIDYRNYVSGQAIHVNQTGAYVSDNPVKVSNNYIKGSLGYGIKVANRVKNAIIENNTIVEGSDSDIYLESTAGLTTVGGHLVTGNTIKRKSATFTGRIDDGVTPGTTGSTLTVVSGLVGTIQIGQQVYGTGVTAGTYIVAGSGNVWTVNQAQSVASTSTMSAGLSPGIYFDPQSSALVTTITNNTIIGANTATDPTNNVNCGVYIRGNVNVCKITNNNISGFYYGLNFFAYQVTQREAEISYNIIDNCFSGILIGSSISPSPYTVPLVGNTFSNLNVAGSAVANKGGIPVGYQCQRLGPTLIANLAALPTNGSWVAGDKIFYTAPTSGNDWGMVCTVTGQFGTLSARANATNGSSVVYFSSVSALVSGFVINLPSSPSRVVSGIETTTITARIDDGVSLNTVGNTLTVTAVSGPALAIGSYIVGSGILANTYITAASGSVWTLSSSQGATFTGRIDDGTTPGTSGNTLTVDSGLVGTLVAGQTVSGLGVTAATIAATANPNVWTISGAAQNVTSRALTVSVTSRAMTSARGTITPAASGNDTNAVVTYVAPDFKSLGTVA